MTDQASLCPQTKAKKKYLMGLSKIELFEVLKRPLHTHCIEVIFLLLLKAFYISRPALCSKNKNITLELYKLILNF